MFQFPMFKTSMPQMPGIAPTPGQARNYMGFQNSGFPSMGGFTPGNQTNPYAAGVYPQVGMQNPQLGMQNPSNPFASMFPTSFNSSDLTFTPDRMTIGEGSNERISTSPGRGSLANVGNYFQGQTELNPNNYMFRQVTSQDGMGIDPNAMELMIKSGAKEGTVMPYTLQNGQWVPNTSAMRTQNWDTGNSFQNMGLGLVAAGALASPYITQALGAGAGAGTGAGGLTMTQGAPITWGAGMNTGITSASMVPGVGAAAGGAGAAGAGAAGVGGSAASSGGSLLGNLGASDLLRYGTMAAGALGGASGSGPQSASSTRSLPPWLEALGPQFAGQASEAGRLPNPGLEGFNADQQAAFQAVRNQAGNNLTGAASGLLGDTMSGRYLQGNPYIDDIVRQTTDDLQARFGSTALGSGSFGNANATEAGMRGISSAANALRFQNYDNERSRQMQAAGLAPSINQMGLTNANALLGIGDQQQQFGQQQRENDMAWRERQLRALGIPFGYNMGGTTTETQPGTNRLAGALGGALTAAQIWSLLSK